MPRAQATGRRYTAAQKRRILDAAKRDGLTGQQVKKRFGVSALTFYKWRGPVRRRGRKSGTATALNNGLHLREEVRARLKDVLPQLVREEVTAALADLLGRKSR